MLAIIIVIASMPFLIAEVCSVIVTTIVTIRAAVDRSAETIPMLIALYALSATGGVLIFYFLRRVKTFGFQPD